MTLTKAELADLLFEKVGFNKREAKDMVESFFEEVRMALRERQRREAVRLRQLPAARQAAASGPQSEDRRGNSDHRAPRGDVPRIAETEGDGGTAFPWKQATVLRLQLPPIPAKRYFTIGEVSELCGVKPHVLRYWEQEFTQLKPVKRRGNRRYYQHHEVLLIRRIRELLYDQGFTISGARNRLDELVVEPPSSRAAPVARHRARLRMRKEIKSIIDLLRA